MKTEPKTPLQIQQQSSPESTPRSSRSQQTKTTSWRGFRTELRELGKRFLQYLKHPFQTRSIHSYQVTKAESVTPQVNQKEIDFNSLFEQTCAAVLRQEPHSLSRKQSQNIASAFLVANGLAQYKVPSNGKRTDFSIVPLQKKAPSSKLTDMNAMISRMKLSEMMGFYQQDGLVIPRKAGLLKGTRQLIAGQKRRFTGKAQRNKIEDIEAYARAIIQQGEKLSNPASVYVVVYQDRAPEQPGHAALVIGGKGINGKKPLYVSHLGLGESVLSKIKAVFPGSSTKATSHEFRQDCVQFGMPDFVVELKGMDRDEMVHYLESVRDKGYHLTSHNCATKVGNLLLAGLPEENRKNIHKPNSFWTPYDITVMAQQIWRQQQIDSYG
ncbi:hypothetical protein [Endozoicomonas lisbonensis]|uniref:DUF4105 domain-containing protein n=1 Tax=Endozoicomonas lisbonensis TaxID=3120522 RepID=A0ABV2SLQ2_9GAMM